jgi:hypothetical protein
MRPIPILLSFVAVLGFLREAEAEGHGPPTRDFTVGYTSGISDYRFGFRDWEYPNDPGQKIYSAVLFGPYGGKYVPFTATQGLVCVCVIAVGLAALVTVGTGRWKRRAKT